MRSGSSSNSASSDCTRPISPERYTLARASSRVLYPWYVRGKAAGAVGNGGSPDPDALGGAGVARGVSPSLLATGAWDSEGSVFSIIGY